MVLGQRITESDRRDAVELVRRMKTRLEAERQAWQPWRSLGRSLGLAVATDSAVSPLIWDCDRLLALLGEGPLPLDEPEAASEEAGLTTDAEHD